MPVAQVDGDAHLLELWLHGRSPHTQRAYRTDLGNFLAFVSKPLRTVTVGDVQAWMDTLEEHLAPGSRARKTSSVKSLFGFGHRLGYLPFDVGRVVKRPKLKDTLAERILSEGDPSTAMRAGSYWLYTGAHAEAIAAEVSRLAGESPIPRPISTTSVAIDFAPPRDTAWWMRD